MVTRSPSCLSKLSGSTEPSSRDDWRDKVGETETRIVEDECGEIAEQLGYGRLIDAAPIHPVLLRVTGPANASLVA